MRSIVKKNSLADIDKNNFLHKFIAATFNISTKTGLVWTLWSVLFNNVVNCYDYMVLR